MQQLNPSDQKVFISQLQNMFASLPVSATNPDVLTVVDMVEKSESLGITEEALTKSIASDKEPFMVVFHTGSEASSSESLAFQIELYLTSWTVRVGTRATDGTDFLVSFNDLTVSYANYLNLTVDSLVESIFTTFKYLLSGQLSLLTSKYPSGDVYATEIILAIASEQKALAIAWFGEKTIKQPATTSLLMNTLLTVDRAVKYDYILNQQKEGTPLFSGRTFDNGKYTPLTYSDYQLYAPKNSVMGQKKGSLKSLSVIFIAIVILYLSITTTRLVFPDSIWPVVVLLAVFVILMGFLARKFPFILLAGLAPLVAGFVTFGAFIGIGTVAYANIPELADAVDGDSTALSMVIVLGWAIIGFIVGIFAFVKTEKYLTKLALEKTNLL
ncbi:MAG: hypothetical protein ACOH18_04710 [Candidatus Saccharimonadaceae bacterium]